jgi:hypothetical protein
MSFIPSASTITLTTKFTTFGRTQLLNNNLNLITKFSLGDSDANYRVLNELSSGNVPEISGGLSTDIPSNVSIRSKLIVNNNGDLFKNLSSNNFISQNEINLGVLEISANTRVFKINRLDTQVDELVNLFSSFGLPITDSQKYMFDVSINSNGGFSDTAIKNINQDNVLVISLDRGDYGEMIDGRVLKLEITTTGSTYDIFSTYQKNLNPLEYQDVKTSELNSKYLFLGDKIAFLFSDQIKPPNDDIDLSWSTGFNTVKPFSVNKKEQFNFTVNSRGDVDECVGVAYLDKGMFVITNQEIVSGYTNGLIKITFDSIINEVSKNINCVIERGEFNSSTNPTYNSNDVLRFSEIGLYDDNDNLIAFGKTNKHVLLNSNQFMVLSINIII